MRSDRFDRKGPSKKTRPLSEDIVLGAGHVRGASTLREPGRPLRALGYEELRTYQNLDAYPYAFETDIDALKWLCALGAESPSGRLLLKSAQDAGWSVRMDDLAQGGYALDTDNRALLLDHYGFTAPALGRSTYYRHALLLSFIKGLRQIWHEEQDYGYEHTHRPDALLMIERARAADCDTMAILVAWELRACGHGEAWRTMLGSEEGDMAMIFTRAMDKDPAGFYDGSVLTRTFCQWYGDEARVASSDHATLERMDERLESRGGKDEAFGNQPLRAADIEKLSKLPATKPYLSGMGRNICTDPYFMALNDPINESHLFQVAYESSVVRVAGVPFRDRTLARLIFPGEKVQG